MQSLRWHLSRCPVDKLNKPFPRLSRGHTCQPRTESTTQAHCKYNFLGSLLLSQWWNLACRWRYHCSRCQGRVRHTHSPPILWQLRTIQPQEGWRHRQRL